SGGRGEDNLSIIRRGLLGQYVTPRWALLSETKVIDILTVTRTGASRRFVPTSAPLRRKTHFTYNGIGPQRIRICTMPSPIVQKLQEEIQVLEHELNCELPKELKRARALGDLSENAEYHMAKQRQDFVSARLMQLKNRLADLSLINMNNIP